VTRGADAVGLEAKLQERSVRVEVEQVIRHVEGRSGRLAEVPEAAPRRVKVHQSENRRASGTCLGRWGNGPELFLGDSTVRAPRPCELGRTTGLFGHVGGGRPVSHGGARDCLRRVGMMQCRAGWLGNSGPMQTPDGGESGGLPASEAAAVPAAVGFDRLRRRIRNS
jgi:hypothetical protein